MYGLISRFSKIAFTLYFAFFSVLAMSNAGDYSGVDPTEGTGDLDAMVTDTAPAAFGYLDGYHGTYNLFGGMMDPIGYDTSYGMGQRDALFASAAPFLFVVLLLMFVRQQFMYFLENVDEMVVIVT